tara:strand:- start:2269 stop:3087 length:819 start_codon:yes stop_codon:yes gene_type:complete
MLDVFNIPGQQDNIKIFYAAGATTWQTWNKPRNCKFIWMMCIGAGAGGGTTGTTSPGFGGGCGAVTRALFPANVLPDVLFIQPGIGAINATAGRSFVSITPSSAITMNLVCISGNAAAGLGGNMQLGETAATAVNANLLNLGTFTSVAGRNQPNTAIVTPLTTTITCPGGNGGTPSISTGANIGSVDLGTFTTPNISGGTIINAGNNSDSGITYYKPFFSLGGAGGNSNNAGVGGKGGDGGIGSGGGGNGGGTVIGAVGGKGGDGLVIIATF